MTALLGKPLLYCYILLGSFVVNKPGSANFHPLHVSTSDISYNAKDGQIEVILTIFTDDFERALEKQYHTKTDLTKPEMHAAMDALVKNYAAGHLQVKSGGVAVSLSYLGYEINREAVNIYLESGKSSGTKKDRCRREPVAEPV